MLQTPVRFLKSIEAVPIGTASFLRVFSACNDRGRVKASRQAISWLSSMAGVTSLQSLPNRDPTWLADFSFFNRGLRVERYANASARHPTVWEPDDDGREAGIGSAPTARSRSLGRSHSSLQSSN